MSTSSSLKLESSSVARTSLERVFAPRIGDLRIKGRRSSFLMINLWQSQPNATLSEFKAVLRSRLTLLLLRVGVAISSISSTSDLSCCSGTLRVLVRLLLEGGILKGSVGSVDSGIRIWRNPASADQRGSWRCPFVYMPYVKKCKRRERCDVMEMVEVASPRSIAFHSHKGFWRQKDE